MSEAEHAREARYLLQRFESWALPRLAARMPGWVLPDHLTLLGIVAAAGIGICYASSGLNRNYLWVANTLWVVNWFGDSLDGTLARIRKIERPRYGYYLDHIVDMFAVAFVCIGLGFSPYLLLSVALAALIMYYLMSINVYLETFVMKSFRFGYDYIGPTEVRVILILGGSALALGFEPVLELGDVPFGTLDFFFLIGLAVMLVMLLRRIVQNLTRLARLEPPNVVKEPSTAEGRPGNG
ncbi:MAG: CDP-alcohol phosphatidyltransferase family protein [Gemmatimonadetes bacterium]|uniref:CDP-alcohol phosphatidyltransferase family protein n=1 Tax=Candidatus Kutchimonas denitrificans TaxID=3056748 RepID=A0AAE4ZA86_9BACT|nr:CDP-alcohol phosphatidyltransferase family protein [Gemmatimonadota bacterium]NIR75537.1 CDP-alcohol phosphatidyltransferase family protein [Candidatus Kutchimonas denitrificans]NIS01851.1 CDP-alcohol phosphatidyltransferase family protein [Gemmatimonadota bacterium]NIT67632.1 CDP-alcohol phosphatidyltransferase family protein [Gemmatimonadota bacterium]NIU53506.1 CDP-alcohol phosphatidyltransferase family protein [Gemmatimonadota bacterium]